MQPLRYIYIYTCMEWVLTTYRGFHRCLVCLPCAVTTPCQLQWMVSTFTPIPTGDTLQALSLFIYSENQEAAWICSNSIKCRAWWGGIIKCGSRSLSSLNESTRTVSQCIGGCCGTIPPSLENWRVQKVAHGSLTRNVSINIEAWHRHGAFSPQRKRFGGKRE